MKYLFVILLSFGYLILHAQKQDYLWLAGGYNIPGNTQYGGTVLDFHNSPPTATYNYRKLNLRSCNASICDTTGNLLCYTNGCSIANGSDEIMENGDTINPGEVYSIKCTGNMSFGYPSGGQSAIILPKPGSDHLYYIFHKGIDYIYDPSFKVVTDHLYYSLVDMSANNGKGKVIEKNMNVMSGYLSFGDITSVKHANGKDWWLMTAEGESNRFYGFLLTENGIKDTLVQVKGIPYNYNSEGGGQIIFSPDGKKMARTHPDYGVNLYDFDRESGLLSIYDSIHLDYLGWDPVTTQCAFSPNNRFLYIACEIYLFQLDLWSPDIRASQKTVAIWDGFKDPIGTTFGHCHLGPDCKIYISSIDCNYYHIIHHPDEPGLACDVEQHGLYFPTPTGATMPNFPNYRLGPLSNPGAPCTSVSSSNAPLLGALPALSVFPNPAERDLNLLLNRPLPGPVNWVLTDVTGRVLRQTVLEHADQTYQVDLGGLPHGVYFYTADVEGRVVQSGKVVH